MSYTNSATSSTEYTDVIIIGNGPSAICLSFFLSGNRPYYNGNPHSNMYLHKKLQEIQEEPLSIVEQDLEFLSEGLEGRTSNPVALLFDNLMRPDADMGAENPSLLDWKTEEEHSIRHIALGKGKVGGSWQKMDGNMQTLSLGNWMELPSVPLKDWRDRKFREGELHDPCSNRATISDVRNYYTDYVASCNLQHNFYDNHVVTSIQKVYHLRSCKDHENGEIEPCCKNYTKNHSYLWEVRGYRSGDQNCKDREEIHYTEFCIQAPSVVIATGTSDIPNKLNITGELLPHVIHSLHEFETALKISNEIPLPTGDPVLIVGAGLSAADAILMALSANIPVIHVFRRGANDPNLIFKKLPESLYPEYHRVHSLMKGKTVDPLYRPYEKHRLVEINEDKRVLLENMAGNDIITVDVTFGVILIGSRPDLSFLPEEGRNLGVVPRHPIDSKYNPIDVDMFSYQSMKLNGLFALGPLVGDNFVRFGIGGAMGITNHLLKMKKKECL